MEVRQHADEVLVCLCRRGQFVHVDPEDGVVGLLVGWPDERVGRGWRHVGPVVDAEGHHWFDGLLEPIDAVTDDLFRRFVEESLPKLRPDDRPPDHAIEPLPREP